jgi:hypothetical protein
MVIYGEFYLDYVFFLPCGVFVNYVKGKCALEPFLSVLVI